MDDMNLWLAFGLALATWIQGLCLGIAIERRKKEKKSPSVRIHVPIVESPYVASDQIFVINPELRTRLFENGPDAWVFRDREPDWDHLPGCRKRSDETAACICGERGRLIRPRQEFGSSFERERKYLLECGHLWWSDDAPVGNCGRNIAEPGHRCVRPDSHVGKGDACMCKCGATTRMEG